MQTVKHISLYLVLCTVVYVASTIWAEIFFDFDLFLGHDLQRLCVLFLLWPMQLVPNQARDEGQTSSCYTAEQQTTGLNTHIIFIMIIITITVIITVIITIISNEVHISI